VTSDWWAQHTGVASALAGLDMTMAGDQNLNSGDTWWGSNLTAAVLNGTIPQWRLDDMVVRIMSAYYKVYILIAKRCQEKADNIVNLGW
jgi:hypothetical protein